jgi:hypothetical protein
MVDEIHPVCAILAGSWRKEPGPTSASLTALSAGAPVLASTGAAGLAWKRIALNPVLRASSDAAQIRSRAQLQVLDAARNEEALGGLARLLHRNDIQPLLFKGWAVARHYSEPHLRPMGDVDLCAPPEQLDELADLLRRHGYREFGSSDEAHRGRVLCFNSPSELAGKQLQIDLHERLDHFFLPPIDEVFARAAQLQVGEHFFLVPSAEDHLRLVAIHFLLHGDWRALSLCDVAAMLEAVPPSFDWDLCLGAEPRRRRWVVSTLELAHELLGARLDNLPERLRTGQLPGWMKDTVLREWSKPFSDHHVRPQLGYVWRHRRSQFIGEVLARWPNAIRSTVELDADLTQLPRWPFQLAHFMWSVGRAVRRDVRFRLRQPGKRSA